MKMIAINVQVPETTDKYLKAKAKERVVTKSVIVRDILRDHVEEAKRLEKISKEASND